MKNNNAIGRWPILCPCDCRFRKKKIRVSSYRRLMINENAHYIEVNYMKGYFMDRTSTVEMKWL